MRVNSEKKPPHKVEAVLHYSSLNRPLPFITISVCGKPLVDGVSGDIYYHEVSDMRKSNKEISRIVRFLEKER